MKTLDKEEKELMQSVERGEWEPIEDQIEEIERLKRVAKTTFTKNRRMNIRISERDLRALKVRALEEGLPYQTLVSSIIHKYLLGKLVEKRE